MLFEEPMWVNYYLWPLLITVIVELVIAFPFGFKKVKEFLAIVLVNIVTNPLLNFAFRMIAARNYFVFLLASEVLVIVFEYFLLVFTFPQRSRKRLLALSLVMNLVTSVLSLFPILFGLDFGLIFR